jgi:hypothetical protein
MRRWFRVVLPSSPYFATCVVGYLLIEMTRAFCLWYWGVGDVDEMLRRLGGIWVCVTAVSFGASRVFKFHPLFHADYRRWLKSTPWNFRQPLPVGPIHLVPQDVAIALLLMAMAWDHEIPVLRIPLAFLAGYLIALDFSLWFTGAKQQAYLVAFGLGLVLHLRANPAVTLVAAAGVYGLGFVGLRRSLERFPWTLPEVWNTGFANMAGAQDLTEYFGAKKTGWPCDEISPRRPSIGIGYADALAVSLLAGWWVYVLMSTVAPMNQAPFAFVAAHVMSPIALFRAGIYCNRHDSPISLWGRLWTGRWIIPGYDVVLVAPLIGAAVAYIPLRAAADPGGFPRVDLCRGFGFSVSAGAVVARPDVRALALHRPAPRHAGTGE